MSIVEIIKNLAEDKGQVWKDEVREYWQCGLFSVVKRKVPLLNYEEMRNEEDGSHKDTDRPV